MKTGIFGGFLTGTALSAIVLGGASVLTYPAASVPDPTGSDTSVAETPSPEATEVDVPAGSEFRQSREDTQADLPTSDETPGTATKPQILAPQQDDLAALGVAATAPNSQPSPGTTDAGLNAPEAYEESSGLNAETEEPVLQSPQSLAPQTPAAEEDLSISTEPAQPIQPDVENNSVFEDETLVDEAPEVEADPDVLQSAVPDADTAPTVQTEIDEPVLSPDIRTEPETDEAPQIAELPDTEPGDQTEPPFEVDPAASGTIGNIADNVTTGRLPSVLPTEEEEATEDEETDEAAPEIDVPQTPLHQYSTDFENLEGKPLMSFVLLDEGNSPIDFNALADFPYPISYAVDIKIPNAAETAKRYRDAGLEVLAMIDLPEGANASDTEVAMQLHLNVIDEAVAVMEGVGTGLQSSREATEQLIPILLESGHGLVLFSEGFDTAQKLITREGVPALSVFRDIDNKEQSAAVIRRFLDQAAFRAGQEDTGVIVVGRLRAETVSALLLWGLQDRANSVAIAPVSALLKGQITQ